MTGSNGSLNISNLKAHRDEILKAEIGSLLFNLGKTHVGFWAKKKDENEVVYFNVDGNSFEAQYGFKPFCSYKKYYEDNIFCKELDSTNQRLKDFIYHQDIRINNEVKNWVEFFKGGVSESDIVKKVFFKGCENINSGIDKGSPREQLKTLWISNAFGSYIKNIDKCYFDTQRINFFATLHSFLNNNNYYTAPNWSKIRNFVIEKLKAWYSLLLSDSRFPVNDVTLWDQAYMSATMFKASLAGMLLNTSQSQNYKNNPRSIKWQILGVQYDKLALAEKGLKAAHIIWYRGKSKQVDEEIKKLLEIEYALGNEVYRDETGIYFLVPEGTGDDNIHNDLNCINTKINCIFKKNFNDEIYPYVGLSKVSRGTMNLTFLLQNAKENFLNADYSLKKLPDIPQNATAICQVCQNGFVEKRERDDDVPMCETCKERKKGRIEEWLKNQEGETIWIDELADHHNRIALITLKFELMEWLNGDLLSSLLVRNGDWYNLLRGIKQDVTNNTNSTLKTLLDTSLNDIKARCYIKAVILERTIGDRWEEFVLKKINDWDKDNKKPLNKKIDFKKRDIHWDQLNDSDCEFLSKLLLQFLLRKNPSPARLRRIWESTESFFDNVQNDILDSFTATRKKDDFLKLIEDFPEDKKNQVADTFGYKQYFSIIDPTPISWQFVIPTQKIEDLIDQLQHLYYQHFKFVNGKLPFHIGIVVQNYKKPLYVGIKALRNIRRDIDKWSDIKKEDKNVLKELSCYHKLEEINNNTTDFYSLYETDDCEHDFMLLPSGKGVKKYNTADNFTVYPNTIDFEFLDTNSRRNHIYYTNGKRKIELNSNRPYTWEEFAYFKKFKDAFKDKSAQLQNLISLIYGKMEDWKAEEESFKKFMESTFKQREIKIEDFGISNYGFKEMRKFLDMFDFWHTTLKEI